MLLFFSDHPKASACMRRRRGSGYANTLTPLRVVAGLAGVYLQATKASAAQSRVKMLQKMEKNAAPPPESKRPFRARIKLPTPPPCHMNQVCLSN